MLDKILESLYLKVFVNIVVQRTKTLVHVELRSKKELIEEESVEFHTTALNNEMYDFIMTYIKESPYYYVSIIDCSAFQGALPTCEKNKFSYYNDLSTAQYKCFENKWVFYTSKNDIYELEKKYEDVGLDFIFSPFVVLQNFFKDKINANLAMYVLIQDGFISVAIFENSQLLYAEHLDLLTGDDADDISLPDEMYENMDLDEGIDLEDIDVEENDIEDLDDFGDIEDLDALEDIDEFSQSKDVEEELNESLDTLPEAEEDESFNEDYQRFSLIQSAVAHFYKDEKYESQFIENVYISDCIGVTSDLKKYLEEEMFFNVYVRHADLAVEVCELAKMELGL